MSLSLLAEWVWLRQALKKTEFNASQAKKKRLDIPHYWWDYSFKANIVNHAKCES